MLWNFLMFALIADSVISLLNGAADRAVQDLLAALFFWFLIGATEDGRKQR